MSDPPWAADRPLDGARVRAAIGAEFPADAGGPFQHLGSGWDYDVWRGSDGWLWRFPRRGAVARDHEHAIRAADLGAAAMARAGLAAPRFERFGRAGPDFPYPFLGYRALAGVGADALPRERVLEAGFAEAFGAALRALHGVEVSECAWLAAERRAVPGPRERLDALVERAASVEPELPDDLRSVCAPWLAGDVGLPPPFPGPDRLIHNDVCPEHLLVDPDSGRLLAVIDFDDLAVGDPALDLVGLAGWLGGELETVVRTLPLAATDPGFRARLHFLVRVMALLWLSDGAAAGEAEKHRHWVRNSFSIT